MPQDPMLNGKFIRCLADIEKRRKQPSAVDYYTKLLYDARSSREIDNGRNLCVIQTSGRWN